MTPAETTAIMALMTAFFAFFGVLMLVIANSHISKTPYRRFGK